MEQSYAAADRPRVFKANNRMLGYRTLPEGTTPKQARETSKGTALCDMIPIAALRPTERRHVPEKDLVCELQIRIAIIEVRYWDETSAILQKLLSLDRLSVLEGHVLYMFSEYK